MSLRPSSMYGLTEDLLEEILARVPARSLKRLQSTCKKWKTLFDDRRFTKKHFDNSEKEYLDLMFSFVSLTWMSVNLHRHSDNTYQSAIEFKGEFNLTNLYNNSDDVDQDFEVFHCNGLLLCTNSSSTMVWNPCTGQTKWILTKNANRWYHKYALGYVNKESCRDYKILRFSTRETFEMEIFDFNSGSWRVCGSVNPDLGLHIGIGAVSVKGNTYWIGYDKKGGNKGFFDWFLISFDFTTERFGPHLCLPFHGPACALALYSIREERLSVLFHDKDALKIEIWKTDDIVETNAMSWSIFLRIDLTPQFVNDGVNYVIPEANTFAVFREYVFLANCNHIISYIIGDDRCMKVNRRVGPLWPIWPPQMFSYVPSLVQI